MPPLNITTNQNNLKPPKINAQGLPVNAVTQSFLPAVQQTLQAPTIQQSAQQAAQAGTQAVTQALQQTPESIVRKQQALVGEQARREQATTQQQFQDVLGKTGLTGTLRGAQAQAGLLTQQAKQRADIKRETEIGALQEAQRRRETAVQQALGFGELGARERATTGQLALGGAEIASREQMQLREFGQAEKILGMEQAFTGNQNELDRRLTREVEAGRISQADADRASREWAVREQIKSSETLANMNIGWQRELQGLNADLEREGWDRDDARQATTIAFETRENALNRDLQRDQMAQNASQFDDELEFKQWAEQNRVDDAEANRAWQTAENAKNRAIDEGELALKGKQLGLESDRLDLMREEVLGKLNIETQRLQLAVQAQNADEQQQAWTRAYDFASLMEPEQAAAMLTQMAGQAGIDVPQLTTDQETQDYLTAANGDAEAARQAAFNDGKILGIDPPAPGQGKSNPIVVGGAESPTSRLGKDSPMYLTPDGWKPITEGQHVEFSNNMNSDLGFAVPAGQYQVLGTPSLNTDTIATLQLGGGTIVSDPLQIKSWLVQLPDAQYYVTPDGTQAYLANTSTRQL